MTTKGEWLKQRNSWVSEVDLDEEATPEWIAEMERLFDLVTRYKRTESMPTDAVIYFDTVDLHFKKAKQTDTPDRYILLTDGACPDYIEDWVVEGKCGTERMQVRYTREQFSNIRETFRIRSEAKREYNCKLLELKYIEMPHDLFERVYSTLE